MENNFHIFRKNKRLKMQDNFIFFDTEADSEQVNDETVNLHFKLGSCIIWNRDINQKNSFIFKNSTVFWDNIENGFNDSRKNYIMFAHNTHFDFKMVDGFNQLNKRGWKLINHYVRNKTYILLFQKGKYILHIWDTTNYVPHKLEKIGETIGFPKLDINFNDCTEKELEIYCMRDTEILFVFISNLINFLLENDLSRLKATASSLSFNIFRHKFYDINNKTIWIHDFKRAIRLERKSYKGGITDVFRLGNMKNIYKTDINSMYSDVMKKIKVPTKLIYYSHESDKTLIGMNDDNDCSLKMLTKKDYEKISKRLKNVYDLHKKDYGIIANCTIFIPKKYAYLLQDFGLGKTSFAWGKFEITLCTPELNFVERYGKILKIHELSVYETNNIFENFVDFFYELKRKYSKESNEVYTYFTKLILNGQYGKWGQKEFISERMDETHEYLIKNQDLILDIIEEKIDLINNSSFVYLGTINSKELYVIDNKLHIAYSTKNNSKDSFVAISSFITSQARMDLVSYILIVGRENLCYTDTDSLFVNEKGFKILLENDYINDYELGKLKKEGFGNGNFYNPKFYDFEDLEKNELERKCKGVNLKNEKTILLMENEYCVKYQIEQWDKFKKDMKKGNFNNQFIRIIEKLMSKKYDKGKILDDGIIEPFHISEILNNTM